MHSRERRTCDVPGLRTSVSLASLRGVVGIVVVGVVSRVAVIAPCPVQIGLRFAMLRIDDAALGLRLPVLEPVLVRLFFAIGALAGFTDLVEIDDLGGHKMLSATDANR